MTTIERLRELERAATKAEWFALWKDGGGTGYPSNAATAFEFVGVPTRGSILTGCEASVVAGVEVAKGSKQQSQAHADIEFIVAARNALPAALAVIEAAEAEIRSAREFRGRLQEYSLSYLDAKGESSEDMERRLVGGYSKLKADTDTAIAAFKGVRE